MKTISTLAVAALLSALAGQLAAQNTSLSGGQLATRISQFFDVYNTTPPYMEPKSGTFKTSAVALNAACEADGYVYDWLLSDNAIYTTVNGVPIQWCQRLHESWTWNAIVFVTGWEAGSHGSAHGGSADARARGKNATAYAIAAESNPALSYSNAGWATALARGYEPYGNDGGYSLAWAGDALHSSANAGGAVAGSNWGEPTNHAEAIGGNSVNGTAGYARSWSTTSAEAWGGNASGSADGAYADARDTGGGSGGTFVARGGGSSSGTGGYGWAFNGQDCQAYGGDSTNGHGGEAWAATNAGNAYAEGGTSVQGGGDGGLALADCTGFAVAVGGTAGNPDGPGDGGQAIAFGDAGAEAYGGHALEDGDGGDATAESLNGGAYAVGGDTVRGDAGEATADAGGFGADSNAHGGISQNGRGGDATATGTLSAAAMAGAGAGNGDGGIADALATAASGVAYAQGGDAVNGNGGNATAEGSLGSAEARGGHTVNGALGGDATAIGFAESPSFGYGARAFGGNVTSGVANSTGGRADSIITSINSGVGCYAQGGIGRTGGDALADCDDNLWPTTGTGSGGEAVAVGGSGLHPTGGNSNGGDAESISTATGGTAESFGGDGSGGGTGGDAIARGPSGSTTEQPHPGDPAGEHAFRN